MKDNSIIKPVNKEQEDAVASGIAFLKEGDPSEFHLIAGKAGTGKTTIAEMILRPFTKDAKILVCALSHKAKLVISEKLVKSFGAKVIISKSVAGALGMNMDIETGKFTLERSGLIQPAIKQATIILVDEASMINEQSHELIMKEKRKKARVIYLGDIRQLPPIREQDSIDVDQPSPVFFGKNYSILNERIRQGEESPILPFADFFGDNSRKKYPSANPAPADCRKNIVSEKGSIVFADNVFDVIETFLPLYKYAVEKKELNIIKTVTYRNLARRHINNHIRTLLFGNIACNSQFVVNELIIFQDNYTIDIAEEPISNSYETQVTKVDFITDRNYKVWQLEIIYESRPVSILVLDQSEIKRHSNDVSELFRIAKALPYGSDERSEALSNAWMLKNKYAPVEYAYAITSHKAQGSTYNTVIVDELDISGVSMISYKARAQSMYTAITRASTTCIIIDGQEPDETLKRAAELSFKKLNP